MEADKEYTYADTVLMVCSCDKYEDVWLPCSLSIDKHWPDCPFEKVLLTETKKAPTNSSFSRTVNVSSSVWTEGVNQGVSKVDKDFVVFLLEDQWPTEKINTQKVLVALDYMRENTNIGAIYLEPSSIGGVKNAVILDENYNELPFGAPYRLSCAPSIFRTDFFRRITSVSESAWEFERRRSLDTVGADCRILEVKGVNWKRVDDYGAVARGKWVRKVQSYSRKTGIPIDFSKRKKLYFWDMLIMDVKGVIFNMFPKTIVKIQNHINGK